MSICHFASCTPCSGNVPPPPPVNTVAITNRTSSSAGTGGTQTAIYQLLTDGNTDLTTGDDITNGISGEWWTGQPEVDIGDLYEVRATLNSGVIEAGTFDVWLPLSSFRAWSNTTVGIGTTNGSMLIEIGLLGVNTALDSAIITINSEGII